MKTLSISDLLAEELRAWSDGPPELIPASRFTFEQLAEAYNQARADYVIPMPMDAPRLRAYVRHYDIDLALSAVAVAKREILGLGLLGVRPGKAWITRLGVMPWARRAGVGTQIMQYLLAQAQRAGAKQVRTEVIAGNEAGYRLCQKHGFRNVRELRALRRPPCPVVRECAFCTLRFLPAPGALELLLRRQGQPVWMDEFASMKNAGYLAGLAVELADGAWGWLVYQNTLFQLGHLVLQTEVGDPFAVGSVLLHWLHRQHPLLDTRVDHLPVEDPHGALFGTFGYLDVFHKTEMEVAF